MSSNRLTPHQVRFINNLAELLGTWSLSTNAARLYGYLQIMNEPVSLDDISRDLEISRSHAHTAARMLEEHGNARRMSTRGSKRIVYVCGDDPGTPLQCQIAALGAMSKLIAETAPLVATGAAAARLHRLSDFHGRMQNAMQGLVDLPSNDLND
jgi:DNA-binding transcriptional regulator GbsR (MarR family)